MKTLFICGVLEQKRSIDSGSFYNLIHKNELIKESVSCSKF